MAFSSILGFNPEEVLLPSEPQADDDYLNEKPMRERGSWSYDPDFSCNPDE